MHNTSRPQKIQHLGSFCVAMTKSVSISNSRSCPKLWIQNSANQETHYGIIIQYELKLMSSRSANPEPRKILYWGSLFGGSIHFVLISMQERVHPTRNFSYHVKNHTKPTLGSFYFVSLSLFHLPQWIDHYQIELINLWGYDAMQVLPISHM